MGCVVRFVQRIFFFYNKTNKQTKNADLKNSLHCSQTTGLYPYQNNNAADAGLYNWPLVTNSTYLIQDNWHANGSNDILLVKYKLKELNGHLQSQLDPLFFPLTENTPFDTDFGI